MGANHFEYGILSLATLTNTILESSGIFCHRHTVFHYANCGIYSNSNFNKMIWAKQTKGWGMGNFINITPSIKWIYSENKAKVPIYFEEVYLKDLIKDWELVRIIDEMPDTQPTVNSRWANKYNGKCPDYVNVQEFIGGHGLTTYCDKPEPPLLHNDYVCFIRGSIKGREQEKDPGEDIYYHAIKKCTEAGLKCVYVGVEYDYQRWGIDFVNSFFSVLGNLRAEMSYINGAKFIVTNDTGLYHVGGAYQKKGFVFWKDTDPVKNATPNPNYFISHKGNWFKDFDRWIK